MMGKLKEIKVEVTDIKRNQTTLHKILIKIKVENKNLKQENKQMREEMKPMKQQVEKMEKIKELPSEEKIMPSKSKLRGYSEEIYINNEMTRSEINVQKKIETMARKETKTEKKVKIGFQKSWK
ncbi:hypothetical protein ILUMI_13361 [Ignelater luminosus]|uniref:Uncharacterized protein n=1 Tax=Ignelater luminosus TaxID=2038154 RepID=A0A8K0G8R0_IGNLU|nr:hypothetical protein ILUMI_13361 [Ignelater luminosus]